MVDDFENYADLNGGATAESIRAAADSPSSHTTTMQALVDDLADDSQQIRANVEGDIEDATTMNLNPASSAARRLTQSGLFAVGLLNSFADTVEIFDTEVEAINTELHNNTYARWQAQESSTGDSGDPDNGSTDLSYAEIKRQEKAKLQSRYNQADTTLETEADRVAGLFEGSPDLADVKALVLAGYIPLQYAGIWPNLQLTDAERQQAQIGTVREMTPQEQADYVRNTKEIPAGVADVLTPEAQQLLAGDVAGDIKDQQIDAATVRILDLLKEKEPFTTALYTNVSPDEMADAIRTLNSKAFPGVAGMGDESLRPQLELYDKFMNAAGVALATYSRNTPNPVALAQDYYDAITSDDPQDRHNSAALTLLLREGGEQEAGVFDARFMDKLTTDVLTWEKSHDGDPVWGPRDTGIRDPDATWNHDRYGGRTAADGLANLLGAMGHSPEAAQAFFQNDEGNIDSGILDYLIGHKDGDDVDGRTFSSMNGSDEGDGLGEALEAASVGGGDPRFAAEFTTDVFSRIADLSGHDPTDNHDTGWHVWENMTDSLGTMASGYTGDIYELMRNSAPDSDPGLDLTPEQMAKVLGEIGSSDNKDGLTLLTSAMMLELNHQTDKFLDGLAGPHTLDALNGSGFTGLQTEHGTVMGNLLNNGLSVSVSNDELAKKQEEIMSRALDIVSGFVPGAGKVLGEGASELAKMSFDTLKGQAMQELKDGIKATPDTDGYLDQATGDINTKIKYSAMNVLYQNGYLGPQELEDHKEPFAGVSQDMMIGDPPRIRPDLYDKDGFTINTDKMSPEEKTQAGKAEVAWNDFTDSSAHEVLTDLAYQSAFLDSFTNPEVRVGG
jgi:hypothetical protein